MRLPKSDAKLIVMARDRLGLNNTELALAVCLDSKWAEKTVRRWISGECRLPGAVRLLLEIYLHGHRPASLPAGVDSDRWQALRKGLQ